MVPYILLGIAIIIGTILLFSFIFSLPVYLLWNGCLVGAIAGIHKITWLQAWGLMILSSFLFKNVSIEKKGKT